METELGNDSTQDAIEATQIESVIKPGTRCESTNTCCAKDSVDDSQCQRPAVRTVTIVGRGNFVPIPGYEKAEFRHVPMCEPCAAHHERTK